MSAPHIAAFMDRMNEVGLAWDDWQFSEPLDNGKLYRYDVAGDKAKSRNGWYVLYGGRYPAGCFGSWKANIRFSWASTHSRRLSPDALEAIRKEREQSQRKIETSLYAAREIACKECRSIWQSASNVDSEHPYLLTKNVGAYGIRQYKSSLLIPVRDTEGRLTSLQFINPDGTKYFKSGGRIKGCFHRIGKPKEQTLYVAEGYATAATIHEVTGHAVAVAFNAGNLSDVSISLRIRYPLYELLIAADNDRFTAGNPGLTQARQAAVLSGAGLIVPNFADSEQGSDFNDWVLLERNQ